VSAAAATQAFRKLLERAEKAWTRDSEARITLPMTASSFPAYLDLETLQKKEEFHSACRGAERQGAIEVEWDPLAGKEGQIARLILFDPDKLAAILHATPLWDSYRTAESALAGNLNMPSVQALLAAWREGKRPRAIGPEQVGDVLDALRVISALGQSGGDDIPVRQLSAQLFIDSKRIEKLLPVLDYLTQEDETCTLARQTEDILGALGLVKFPQPVLIAGRAVVHFANGSALGIPAPYIGLAPQSLARVEAARDARYILTVENYTTFNEIAKGKAGPVEGVVIYTAGMPSPSFLRVYAIAIDGAFPEVPVYHWGDIDLGGYRIADVLARHAGEHGRRLRLWNMNPGDIEGIPQWAKLSTSDLSWIRTIALKHGWATELAGVETSKSSYEQEMLPVRCPSPPAL